MLKKTLPFLILLNFLLISCENGLEGNLKENLTPSTSLTLGSINLPEGERLLSQVKISWWGDDPDGYIIGYEFYIGDPAQANTNDWTFTEKADSIFILPIPENTTDADVTFSIRAVDNENAKDEDPPSLVFPIRNTAPTVVFNATETPPDTTFSIASFGFTAADPDGNSNLNRIEVALNDTTSNAIWIEVPLSSTLLTLKIETEGVGANAKIFVGKALQELSEIFEGVLLNSDNELFIRSIDNAESISEVKSYKWFLKEQTSRILFLNDYSGNNSQSRADLHLDLLNQLGISSIDYIDISDGSVAGGTRVQLTSAFHNRDLSDPTINLALAQWDYIYWISDDLNRNIGYALELTSQFFENGGKMFVNIPIEFISSQNSLFQFLPFQGVQAPPDERNAEFIIQKCEPISKSEGLDFQPELRFRNNVFPSYPIIPFSESIDLFQGNFKVLFRNPTAISDYDGINTVSAMNPEQSILYFGFDLNEFTTASANGCKDENDADAPPSDLKGLIEFIVIETLDFKQ